MTEYTIRKETSRRKWEFRWKCTCGKVSVWFDSRERRDVAADKHKASHRQCGYTRNPLGHSVAQHPA